MFVKREQRAPELSSTRLTLLSMSTLSSDEPARSMLGTPSQGAATRVWFAQKSLKVVSGPAIKILSLPFLELLVFSVLGEWVFLTGDSGLFQDKLIKKTRG